MTTTRGAWECATFVARDNRFVARARRSGGDVVRAYLPNTARLGDVLVPGAPVVLERAHDPARRTGWTLTRVRDGGWVSLEAGRASDLVAAHLAAGAALPGWPAARTVRREVTRRGHRFDLEVALADGREAIVEVKSLSRARDGVAPLSRTPSSRGVAHLRTLAQMAGEGLHVAVVFVVQRGDVRILDLGADADRAWTVAVRAAAGAGVHVVAYGCEVDEGTLELGRPLEVRN